jgi:hypothetical protein
LNGGFSTRYVKHLLPRFMIFFTVFLLSIYLICQKGKTRLCGLVMAALSIALMIDHHPFKSSRFDAYHGDQGTAPYQEVIDYVGSRGGLVFWAHPESSYAKTGVELGPIKMVTKPYPAELVASKNYTGFAAIYGDSSNAAEAGKYWDRVLQDYCRGNRNHAAWAIAEADFHEEQKGFDLDSFQTIFLVKNKSSQEVIQALERGRVYAVRKSEGMRLALEKFQVQDKSTGRTAIMGEKMNARKALVVGGRLSASDNGGHAVTVSVIRGGKQAWSFEGQTPLDFQLVDQDRWRGTTFYRLAVKGREGGYLLSNPIFVTRTNN